MKKKFRKGSWLYEINMLVENMPNAKFSLDDMYKHEKYLKSKFPKNNFVDAAIRHHLQILRDHHVIEFLDNDGHYRRF